jgi:hypothetical protein
MNDDETQQYRDDYNDGINKTTFQYFQNSTV